MSTYHRLLKVLSSVFICALLFSGLTAPSVYAQGNAQTNTPNCPRVEPSLLRDKNFLHSLPVECIKVYKDLTGQANASEIQATAVGGPDSFGYTYDDSVSYSWISAGTNSGLTGDDEFTGPIDIGFDFPFYGLSQSQLYFSTNGLITFNEGNLDWSNANIPTDLNPNNFIAPFWEDLRVGSPYNNGAIYYSMGGSAPNRYFVVEWRNVEYWYNSTIISFEAILHENGDIAFQYQSLPDSYWPTVGIEDSNGYDGLQDTTYWSGNPLDAVRFYYPAPSARVFVSPAWNAGGFASIGEDKDFDVTIANSGGLGADTYDLTVSSSWSVALYESDGVTPLTDTDGDSVIDTGLLAQGASTSVILRFSPPEAAQIGDQNSGWVTIKSSLNSSKFKQIGLSMSIPASFVNVFDDNADGAMSLMTATSAGTATHKASSDNLFGFDTAMISMTGGNYLYVWANSSFNGTYSWVDLEYTILTHKGTVILPTKKLTDNSSTSSATMYIRDSSPAVALTPNGTIGVIWSRYMYNDSTGKSNFNIFFATLDSSGTRLTGPTNLTNNATWSANGDLTLLRFLSPTIAASDDNRFILGWEVDKTWMGSCCTYDNWYAVRSSTGASLFAPTVLTIDGMSWQPVLNSLTGGKAIMTWGTDLNRAYYAVISSTGAISKPASSLGIYPNLQSSPDAVQLPNGKIAIAWPADDKVGLTILNSSFNILSGPTLVYSATPDRGESLSLTTDALSHGIMTWTGPNNSLIYALADSNGVFVTDPMIYRKSGEYIDVSWNGQGNAPYPAGNPIKVTIGGAAQGTYNLLASEHWRQSYNGLNNGPVKIESTNGKKIAASERVAYSPDGGATWTSYSELMGMPVGQLTNSYVFPWYNNVDLNSQLRFGNAGTSNTTVTVTVGGQVKGTYPLAPNQSIRISYAGLNAGPVKVTSSGNVPIIASMRIAYFDGTAWTSFSEMMGLPAGKLTNSYIFPWYNNIDLNTQLRFGNVGTSNTTVTVTIGGTVRGTYNLGPNQSTRVSYPNVNSGPIKVTSSGGIPIIASIRVAYTPDNGVTWPEFAEMMGLPTSSLSTSYSFPVYDNIDHNTQLRVGNAGTNSTSVTVTIGGVVQGIYSLAPNQSTRISYAGLDTGPVVIQSSGNVPIIASERVAYFDTAISNWTSFAEMMGLPKEQLTTSYLFPWYNNADLNTQLRFGVP